MRQFFWVCLLVSPFVDAQSASFVRYDGYSAVDFDSSPGFFTPTATDCVTQSIAIPYTNGAVYNDNIKSCKLLTVNNNELLIKVKLNVGWTVYVKNIADQERLVFKTEYGYSSVVANTNAGGLYTGVATAYTQQFSASVASLVAGSSCGCTYRNPVIDTMDASQINLEFYKSGLKVTKWSFRSFGPGNFSWFGPSNLLAAAPYSISDIFLNGSWIFQMGASTTTARSFSVGSYTTTNCVDYYFISSTTFNYCSYESAPWPRLIYSATTIRASGGSAGQVYADFLVISAKIKSRVTITP